MPGWTGPSVALLSAIWLGALVAAPVLWTPLAAGLYAAGALICHQLPERSFHMGAVQLPVCARCIGLYGGGALGSFCAAFGRGFLERASLLRGRRAGWTLTAIAAIPTIVTFVVEWGLRWPVSNVVRGVTAVPLGLTVAFVVLRALPTLHYETCAPPRPIASNQHRTNI